MKMLSLIPRIVMTLPVIVAPLWSQSVPERIFRDIHGQALPFQSDAEAEEFLRTAEVTSSRDIGTGVTKPKQLVLEKDGLEAHAAFNYVDTRADRQDMGDGTTELYYVDSYQADIAAYKLSRLLGMEMIPPGVEREIEGMTGVVRLWVEDLQSYREWLDAGGKGEPDSLYLRRQLKDQNTFDLLIRNTDRNATNINWDPDYSLWLIDQTRSMGRHPELKADLREDFKGCSRALFEALVTLDKKSVKRELENYLSAFEINALMKRRDKLIKLIDGEIKKKGESEILFNYTDPPKGLVIKYEDE